MNDTILAKSPASTIMQSATKNIFVGNFGFKTEINGQVVKTKYVHAMLTKLKDLETIDVSLWYRIIRVIFILGPSNFYVLLGKKGIVVFALLSVASLKLHQRKLHFILVGGWFPQFLADNRLNTFLFSLFKRRAVFYCESHEICLQLEKLGYSSKYFPNFRNLESVPFRKKQVKNLKLVFLSRVTEDKGVFEAISLAKNLSEFRPCTLDIYGPCDPQIEGRLERKIRGYNFIRYNGTISPDRVQHTLKDFDFLVFPTKYSGECMPGVLVEAYSVGLPILTTNWRFMKEYVDHRKTGFVFDGHRFVEDAIEELMKITDYELEMLKENVTFMFDQFYSKNVALKFFEDNFNNT